MMDKVATTTQWLYVRPWRHVTVLWLIFASIITHSLATTISPTTGQRIFTERVTTFLPSDSSGQVTNGNELEATVKTTLKTQSSSMTPTTLVTTSTVTGDGITTSLPSVNVTTHQPSRSSSGTTSLSYSTASSMPTSSTTYVNTMPLSSTTVGSTTTVGLSTMMGSSTTKGLTTTIGLSTKIGLPTTVGLATTEKFTTVRSSSTRSSSPMGMDSTLAISVTKRLTSEGILDITSDVISGTTSAYGGGNSSKLSVVQWFLIAVALAAFIFFLFICYHFCQVRRSKRDQTYANHNKNFIEYATPQSPKEKWRNSWALEAMIYHIELPQENSAEMEARDNIVFEEDETDASSSNHTRTHLTKL